MKTVYSLILSMAIVITASFQTSCSKTDNPNSFSELRVSQQIHSKVKRQSIGNCWLYATASWLEALYLHMYGEEINVSETYWTWLYFYYQLKDLHNQDKINTGGSWFISSQLMAYHGFIKEGDFIPEENESQMSLRQAQAESYINDELAPGGSLSNGQNRSDEKIYEILDKAFGTNMKVAEEKVVDPKTLKIDVTKAGLESTLVDATLGDDVHQWQYVPFPQVEGINALPTKDQQREMAQIFKRVLKALNDHRPVVMSVMIDFNGLDKDDATFKTKNLGQLKDIGRQGGHMVVLSDYAVDDVPFVKTILDGEYSEVHKLLALAGHIRFLKAKNSWGDKRPDRGLTDGYTNFTYEYLTKSLPWAEEEHPENISWHNALTDFVLPPGY